ncbi:MAG: DNA import protein CedA1 [Ignisphaera sp.]
MDIITLVKDLINKIVIVSWLLFLLTWVIGWAIKGSPIPSGKIRRVGQGLIEDAVWGAFWVAIGTSIFWLISYISTALGNSLPQPPVPQLP